MIGAFARLWLFTTLAAGLHGQTLRPPEAGAQPELRLTVGKSQIVDSPLNMVRVLVAPAAQLHAGPPAATRK